MKKYAIFASFVVLMGTIFVNCINSASWYNQPKSPSMLVK